MVNGHVSRTCTACHSECMHWSMVVVQSSCSLPGVCPCDLSFIQSRSYPVCFQVVGFTTVRMSNRDLSLDDGKLIIPRNANIFLPLGLPHMSSAVYKDADQFLPERWLEPDAEYMPGGAPILFVVLLHAVLQLTNWHLFEPDAEYMSGGASTLFSNLSHAVLRLTNLHLFKADAEFISNKPSVRSLAMMQLGHLANVVCSASTTQRWHWLLCNRISCRATECLICGCFVCLHVQQFYINHSTQMCPHAYIQESTASAGCGPWHRLSVASLVSEVHILYWLQVFHIICS